MYSYAYYPDYLYHHGIKGMKWGVRRFQNRDGSLTSAGQRRRDRGEQGSTGGRMTFSGRRHARAARRIQRDADSLRKAGFTKEANAVQGVADKQRSKIRYKSDKSRRLKRVLGVTLGAAAAAGLAYGGRKLYKNGTLHNARLNAHILGAKSKHGLSRLQSKLSERKVDRLERGGLSGITKTKLRNAGLRAQTVSDRARSALARGKQTVYENGGVGNTIRRKYTTAGGARGIASGVTGRAKSAARYGAGRVANSRFGQGVSSGASTVGRRAKNAGLRVNTVYNKARSATARGRQSLYENGGLGSTIRRAYTTSGGARGIASGVTGRAKSTARYYGGKAADAGRLGALKAKTAGYNAQGAYYDARKAISDYRYRKSRRKSAKNVRLQRF